MGFHLFRERINKRRFKRAEAEAAAKGHMVCGTIVKGGKPVYFTVPRGASDDEVQAIAFKAYYGRPITEGEQILLAAAAAQAQKAAAR